MPRLSKWMIRAALVHLGMGFTIGALLLANKGIPFAPVLWRLRDLHADILIFGWMMQLAMGVGYWALPRFPGQHRYGRAPLGWASFLLLNSGVVISSAALWWRSSGGIITGRVVVLAAAALYAQLMWPRIKPLGGYPEKKGQKGESSVSSPRKDDHSEVKT